MAETAKHHPITIDLNQFRLRIDLKGKMELTLYFNSPSRRFYLSLMAFIVNQMKELGKITSIPLERHHTLLALLNETIGGAAGSSEKENLLPRIYRKWQQALPNLEEAPLFKVLGRKKGYEEGIVKTYPFSEAEKDNWASLFEYKGSEEHVRLAFAVDKIGVRLDDVVIVYEDSQNAEAWDQFISGLMVIARNSTFYYKGKNVQIKQVAGDLGVRYILEGSVRKEEDQLRINAQLIDALTGRHVWAERYDGTRSKIFALQDQITHRIASGLALKLTAFEMQVLGDKGTNKVEAHDAFLRGWAQYLRLTPDDIGKAVASFKKAIELDPDYGRAYAALALVHWTVCLMFALLPGLKMTWLEARLRCNEYLRKGLHPENSIAHQVRSQMCLYRRQYEEAISEMERALYLDPNDPSSHAFMGWTLSMAGRPAEAIEYLKRGMRLDPHNPARYLNYLGVAHFCLGDLEAAVALVEKGLRLNPELSGAVWWIASWGALLGREKEVRSAGAADPAHFYPYGKSFGIPSSGGVRGAVPFRDRAVADQFIEGLCRAGYCSRKILNRPFHPQKENRLTGDEIKTLLFGSTITGHFHFEGRPQWWMEHKKDGAFTSRGFPGISPGSGKSRIEGHLLCCRFEKGMWGLEGCGTVYRNPAGNLENKDEYVCYMDWGTSCFSVVR